MTTFQILDQVNSFSSTDKLTDRAQAVEALAIRIGEGDSKSVRLDGKMATEHATRIIGVNINRDRRRLARLEGSQ